MTPAGKASVAAGARRLAGILLVVLPLVLPFEAPLFALGPLVITTSELAIYGALAAWLVSLRREEVVAAARTPIARAAAFWMIVVMVSALAAPEERGPALKTALRMVAAGLLCFAARDRAGPNVARALLAGAALAAVCALVELAVPASAPLWRPFRSQSFSALGVPRASGAFAYPTIAAMYWEACLPLTCLLLAGARRWWTGAAGVAVVALLLVTAIVLSATRSAVAGVVVAGGALLLVGWRAGARVRVAAGILLIVTAGLVATFLGGGGAGSLLAERLRWWRGGTWFSARYEPAESGPLAAGRWARLPVSVQNTGTVVWPHTGQDAVHLSYHWERTGEGLVTFDGLRTRLPADVAPGERVALQALVRAPAAPGHYRLRWDLVRETVTWFSEQGCPTADQLVEVVASDAAVASAAPPLAGSLEDLMALATPDRPRLWRAALALWRAHPLLGVGPDNFRRLYPQVLEPTPGRRLFKDPRLHANNLYLETLADLGLAGATALLALMIALARALIAQARARDVEGLACGVAAATFFVHGALDSFVTFTPPLGLFWLLMGLAARPLNGPINQTQMDRTIR